MPTIIGTQLPTIALAVEQALLGSVNAGDISNIYWVEENSEPPPGRTGQRDVILYQMDDSFEGSESSTVVGSGRGCAILSGMRVAVRTSLASDRGGSRKDWFIDHEPFITALQDTLIDFFPEDADGNALTIEGFVPTRSVTPAKARDVVTWGQTVCSFKFNYVPTLSSIVP